MTSLLIGQSRKGRLRQLFRKISIITSLSLLALCLIYSAFRQWTHLSAPADDGATLPNKVGIQLIQGTMRTIIGDSWMTWEDGIWRIQLSGDPRTLGHHHGLLARENTILFERHLNFLMQSYLPTAWRRWLVSNAVRWRFRQLPSYIPATHLVEFAAFSRTMLSTEDLPGSPFQRVVYYHALHDLTQRLDGSPLIGCTAFAAWGKTTTNNHLIIGRNFDFEGGALFDSEKALIHFQPTGRIPFVSVAWPGMMGVVTGVNARRIYVSMNAARTDDDYQTGIPMALLLRKILEEASDIKEAIAIIKRHQVMVAEAILIADGKVPEAAVLELSPKMVVVRRASNNLIGVANHLLDSKYSGDASNNWLRRYTTSEARYQRVMELLRRYRGRLDIRTAAMILRNRAGLNDQPLALGNRNAIDALIATHGVLLDLDDMILWVSKGPHLLGAFTPIDLKPLFAIPTNSIPSQPETIPPDPLLDSPELKRHQHVQLQLELARQFEKMGEMVQALALAQQAAQLEPESPDAQLLAGDLLWEENEKEEAKQYYQNYLKLFPPYLRDKERVMIRLNR